MNSLLGSAALWPAEHLLNRFIRSDPHVARQLRPFTGKVLAIHARAPRVSLLIRFANDTVHLSALDAAALGLAEDARVCGSLARLLDLLREPPASRALVDRDMEITGDAQFVQDLFQVLTRLDVDWEDCLAPLLGDTLTHEAARLTDNLEHFLRDARSRLSRSVEDYLKEEKRLVPHHYQRQAFVDGLDTLKLRLDRADARLDRLYARLAGTGSLSD